MSILICVLTAGLATAVAGDWPQYQGPKRDGISLEKEVLKDWPQNGPREIWRIPFGEGYSGLAVVEGRIYTLAGWGSNEYAVCLDASDGSEIWRVRTDANRPDGQGGGPRSTPAVSDGIVYTASARNVLHALRAEDGTIVWRYDLKEKFGSRVPTWGVSGSPLIEGDMLIVEIGGRRGQALAAFDKRTGEVRWTSHSDRLSYSSPVAYDILGVRQILFATASGLVGVDSQDGKVLWNYPWETRYDVNAATPILVGEDKIFYSSSYGKGAVLLGLGRSAGGFSAREI